MRYPFFSFLQVCLLVMVLSGCGMQQTFKGQYYLSLKNYEEGVRTFRQAIQESPRSAEAHYYLGRNLLALKRAEEAESHLLQAVRLNAEKKDAWFWLGVARGVQGNMGGEHEAYTKALAIDPKHLQALIYDGHNRLEAKNNTAALGLYERALAIWPEAPAPLFNRALLFKQLGRTAEARTAFALYLDEYPSGAEARIAADELNALGDFSYRNHLLGKRRVTLRRIAFEPLKALISKESFPSLDLVGDVLTNNKRLTLHVLCYQVGNTSLGKSRALAVRAAILKNHPTVAPNRVRSSWFGVSEKVTTSSGTRDLLESVNFFAVTGQ